MTEKKQDKDEKTIQVDPGQDKDTSNKDKPMGAPKGGYKRKHQLTKNEVLEIIDTMENDRKKVSTLSNKYNCSVSSINKLFNLLRNSQWKPVNENDSLPKGYMMPRNLDETIDSVMYDKGFIRE